jgi:hypothetical protein
MAWVKLSDDFWMHPKVLDVGDATAGVFARLLSYCGCYLTDGLVPEPIVASITLKSKRAIEELERVGMVERLPTGSVRILEYLEHNRSKAEWDKARKTAQENGQKGGRPRSGMNGR